MGVYINDMEMPASCGSCEFGKAIDNLHVYCTRHPYEEAVEYNAYRPQHCPLEEVEQMTAKEAVDYIHIKRR